MHVLQCQNDLRDVESAHFGLKLFEFVDDPHKVAAFHEFKINVNYSLILWTAIQSYNIWVIHLAAEFNFIEQMLLLLVFDQCVLALNFDSHDLGFPLRQSLFLSFYLVGIFG